MVVFTWDRSEEVEAGVEEVVEFFHDPSAMVHASTNVVSMMQDLNDATLWHVTEQLNKLSTIKFSAHFDSKPDGTASRWKAPFGVRAEASWTVKRVDATSSDPGSRSLLREVARVEVPFPFYHYVKYKYTKIHSQLPKKFQAAIAERRGGSTSVQTPAEVSRVEHSAPEAGEGTTLQTQQASPSAAATEHVAIQS